MRNLTAFEFNNAINSRKSSFSRSNIGLDIHAPHPIQGAQPFHRRAREPIGDIIAFSFQADFAGDFDHATVWQRPAVDTTIFNRRWQVRNNIPALGVWHNLCHTSQPMSAVIRNAVSVCGGLPTRRYVSRASCDCLFQQAFGSLANLPLAGSLPPRGINLFLKQRRKKKQRERREPCQTSRFIGRPPQRRGLRQVPRCLEQWPKQTRLQLLEFGFERAPGPYLEPSFGFKACPYLSILLSILLFHITIQIVCQSKSLPENKKTHD